MSHEHDQQLVLEADGMPEVPVGRFNPAQRRAFGSVPGLLGKNLDIPAFEQLSTEAWERTSAEGLRAGLIGRADSRYEVDGVVLNTDEYKAIVRSPKAFKSSIQATTVAARKATNAVRLEEKELKSGYLSFRQKWDRQNKVLQGLGQERHNLQTLLEWQRTPGFSRSAEVDIVAMASQAWNGTFRNMLKTCKEHYQLSTEEYIDMEHALAYRLFRGPQTERVAQWGYIMTAADQYTAVKMNLFQDRQHEVVRFGLRLKTELNDFYQKHGILESV